jgi:hypothetical protein
MVLAACLRTGAQGGRATFEPASNTPSNRVFAHTPIPPSGLTPASGAGCPLHRGGSASAAPANPT